MPLCGPAAVSVKTWSHKLRFLIRRILSGALVLWAVATAVFVLSFVTSRDPAARFAGKSATRPRSRCSGTPTPPGARSPA